MSLYVKHRPDCLEDVEGNEDIKTRLVEMLSEDGDLPNTLMFTGGAGTGKTTFARIIASEMYAELQEINCGSVRSLDEFRESVKSWSIMPLRGGWRVVILDEAHRLPNATQELLLKPLEDGTSSTIIILCTTNPEKIIGTIRSRPVTFKCENLQDDDMYAVIRRVCKKEELKLKKVVVASIVKAAEGSSRMALTLLESVIGLPSELAIKKIAAFHDAPEEVITLCRALMSGSQNIGQIMTLAKAVEGDPETIRRSVLGYACACIPKMGKKAYRVAEAFRDNWYDVGKQGLVLSCYDALGD